MENEPEKLNKLLKTDVAEVKKKKNNNNGETRMQATTVTHVRHLNEQGYNFSIKTTGISSHACCPLEKKGVWLLSVSFLSSEDLFYHQHARV